jgi:8-oxo-dGTP pyrophosphatase MutT (NUDIX family)
MLGETMRIRAVAILIENDKIALIERHRAGRHYYTFPGGGVDAGETVEQAVVREMKEETGLRVAVRRKLGNVWFQGNRQEYFLVESLDGDFGTGTGEEYVNPLPDHPQVGTYHPLWMPLSELLNHPVMPVEIARRVARSAQEGWPVEAFEIQEVPHPIGYPPPERGADVNPKVS